MTLISQVATQIRDAEKHAGLHAHVHADPQHGVIDVEVDAEELEAAFRVAKEMRERFAIHFEAA